MMPAHCQSDPSGAEESQPRRPSHRLGFGRDFPASYTRRVVAEDYWPHLDVLMNDYLAANPTRNRDRDLLPLFLYCDERRVRARLPNEKIGKRAVLHYRLPTARVSQAGWSIGPDWNRWVAVERLAADRSRLEQLAAVYRAASRKPEDWAKISAHAREYFYARLLDLLDAGASVLVSSGTNLRRFRSGPPNV